MLDWKALERSHRRRQWLWGAAYVIGLGLVCAAFALGTWYEPSINMSAETREDIRGIMLAVVFMDALPRVLGFGRKPKP